MSDGDVRLTLRLGQATADLTLGPSTRLLQVAHIWAALDFDSVQVQFLKILALKPPDGDATPLARFVFGEGVLEEIHDSIESESDCVGIPVERLRNRQLFDVVVEDIREALVSRLTPEKLKDISDLWRTVAGNGEESLPIEIVRARVRQNRMTTTRASIAVASPQYRDLLNQLGEQQLENELRMWTALDVRRQRSITFHDLVLGIAQTEFLAIDNDDDVADSDSSPSSSPSGDTTDDTDHFNDDEFDVDDHGDVALVNAATQTGTAEQQRAIQRVRRRVFTATLYRAGSWWGNRTMQCVMLLHGSPNRNGADAIWWKKPKASWARCQTLPIAEIVSIASGAALFPGSEDGNPVDVVGFPFTIVRRGQGDDQETEAMHVTMPRQRSRDAWVDTIQALLSGQAGIDTAIPIVGQQ